jgi:hypothetical protein
MDPVGRDVTEDRPVPMIVHAQSPRCDPQLSWFGQRPALAGFQLACTTLPAVMRGLDPRIHETAPHRQPYVRFPPLHRVMDGRVKPGHDVDTLVQTNWKVP